MIRTSLLQASKMMQPIFSSKAPIGVASIALPAIRFCSESQLSESDIKANRFIQLGGLYGRDNWEKALEAFQKALKLPEVSKSVMALAKNNTGTILSENGRLSEAKECYEEAVKLEVEGSENYKIYEKNLENQKQNIAAASINKLNEVTKPSIDANQAGIEFFNKKEYAPAIGEFKKALAALDGKEGVEMSILIIKENLSNAYFSYGTELMATDRREASKNFAASLLLNAQLKDKIHEMECCFNQISNTVEITESKIFCLELLNEENRTTSFVDALKNSTEELKELMTAANGLIESPVN